MLNGSLKLIACQNQIIEGKSARLSIREVKDYFFNCQHLVALRTLEPSMYFFVIMVATDGFSQRSR
jgi:hypothetical protein